MFTTPVFLIAALGFRATQASSIQARRLDCETLLTSPICIANDFEGLNGVAPSQILYEIIQSSPLPNDTFFNNEEHVTCLFKDAKFFLDDIEVIPEIPNPGTICVYPDDVPQGGLTMGEIRNLTSQLIVECGKCGAISAGHANSTTVPSSARGYLRINWRDPPTCLEQSNCITAKKVNETNEKNEPSSTSTVATPSPSSAAGRAAVGGLGGDLRMLFGSLVCLASAFLAVVIAI